MRIDEIVRMQAGFEQTKKGKNIGKNIGKEITEKTAFNALLSGKK